MGMPEFRTEAENRLIKHVAIGDELDLSDKVEELKTIRASVIYELAIHPERWSGHARGVQLKGAIIVGKLDFESATIKRPIDLVECELREALSLKRAKSRSVNLAGSSVPEINADGMTLTGTLDLSAGFNSSRKCTLRGARITGDLDASGAVFGNEIEKSDSADSAGDVILDADGIRIQGSLYLGAGFRAIGEVRMRGAEILGDLDAGGGTFENPGRTAIDADGLSVEDDVLFNWSEKNEESEKALRFSSSGRIKLEGARIGGSLVCTGASFSNAPGKSTLIANGVRINGDFIATSYRDAEGHNIKFESNGSIQLAGARIQGTFNGSRGAFKFIPDKNILPDRDEAVIGAAIYADGIRVDGDIELQYSTINGTLRLRGGTIQGDIYCNALTINALTGQFDMWKEIFKQDSDDEGLSNLAMAINADGLDVKGDLFLNNEFSSRGQVRLKSARIGGDLDCSGLCRFQNSFGTAFRIQGAQISGRFTWKNHYERPIGVIDFTHANVGRYDDDQSSWPHVHGLTLDGFTYGALASQPHIGFEDRARWLSLQGKGIYIPQPYEQLIHVFRSTGHEEDAKEIAIIKRENLCEHGKLKHWSKIWNQLLGILIGHGYRPFRILRWMGAFIVLGSVIFGASNNSGLMIPSRERVFLDECYFSITENCKQHKNWTAGDWVSEPNPNFYLPRDYPNFEPIFYSIDLFIPLVDFHLESYWIPTSNSYAGKIIKIYMWFHIAIGWFLTTIGVIGLSGLVKQD